MFGSESAVRLAHAMEDLALAEVVRTRITEKEHTPMVYIFSDALLDTRRCCS